MNTPVRAGSWKHSWAPYVPSSGAPWDVRRVVHLHRRAGFAATRKEVDRDRKEGPAAAVDRLLNGTARVEGVPEDFERRAAILGSAAVSSGVSERLQAWWMFRCLFTPDPLTERLTLMWHNHFATSHAKVSSLAMMHSQNETLRRHGRGPFRELLAAMLRDPALLVWLDAPANRAGRPNENLARELMELFTLGIGHYSEADVREAARALTGWTARRGRFLEDARHHDIGEKSILGQRGSFGTQDLMGLLLEHPATARRLVWRVTGELMGTADTDPEALEDLADGLRAHDLDIGWLVETVLRSRRFFAATNIGARVTGPVEFLIGSVRAVQGFDPPPRTFLLAEWAKRMGQEVFHPPNVGGWSGGADWLTSRHVVARSNFAAALLSGKVTARDGQAPGLLDQARQSGCGESLKEVLLHFEQLLLLRTLDPETRDRILRLARKRENESVEPLLEDQVRRAVTLLLSIPEGQLA